MDARPDRFLLTGAALSGLAALMHVGIIFGGPEWYRFFGAGEEFARLDAAGSRLPDLVTLGIATVLSAWALYALSGAGLIRRLPLLRAALVAITAIYLLRALVILPMALLAPAEVTAFGWWSSAICLIYGLTHLAGLRCVWTRLRPASAVNVSPPVAETRP